MKKGYKTDRKNTIQGYNKNARCEKSRRPIKNISLKNKEGPCKQRNQLCNRDEKGVPPAVSVLPNPLYVFSRDIFQEKIYYPGINGWFPEYPKQTPQKSFLGNLVETARDGDNGKLVAFMRENFKLSAWRTSNSITRNYCSNLRIDHEWNY